MGKTIEATLMPTTSNVRPWLPRVVIIDDDPVSAGFLGALLKQDGFLVAKAADGAAGRALVAAECPDLVLLDVQMPDESGLETCKRLKQDQALAEIPVIFLTASEDLHTKLQGFEAGAVDYITKPYQAEEVIARIRVHIRARRSLALLTQSQMSQLENLGSALRAIMPDPDDYPEFRFQVQYLPVVGTGGDFYDVLQAGGGVFDYVVADVCGHEADASLMTSALKVLLYQGQSTLSSPQETLRMVNRALLASFPEPNYLTLVWARLNRSRKTLSILSAGHPQVLVLRPGGPSIQVVPSDSDVLGMFEDAAIQETTLAVEPGDRIILYTDGAIEIPDALGVSRDRGLDRLSRFCLAGAGLGLAGMVAAVAAEVRATPYPIEDDILILALEV